MTVDGSTHVYHRVVATHREHAGLEPTFKVHARRAAAAAARYRARPRGRGAGVATIAPPAAAGRPAPSSLFAFGPTLIHARRYSIWTQREPGPIGTEERVNGLGFSLAPRIPGPRGASVRCNPTRWHAPHRAPCVSAVRRGSSRLFAL